MNTKKPSSGLMPTKHPGKILAREIEEEKRSEAAALVTFKDELGKRLDALAANTNLTRDSTLELLQTIYEALSPLYCRRTKDSQQTNPDDAISFIDHPAIGMLLKLIQIKKHPDKGGTTADTKSSGRGNNSLNADEERKNQVLIDSVYIFQRAKKIKHRSRAELELAGILARKGYKIRGKKPTKSRIKAIIDRKNRTSSESLEQVARFGTQKKKRGRPKTK